MLLQMIMIVLTFNILLITLKPLLMWMENKNWFLFTNVYCPYRMETLPQRMVFSINKRIIDVRGNSMQAETCSNVG